jgi:hypothetical protein
MPCAAVWSGSDRESEMARGSPEGTQVPRQRQFLQSLAADNRAQIELIAGNFVLVVDVALVAMAMAMAMARLQRARMILSKGALHEEPERILASGLRTSLTPTPARPRAAAWNR